MGKKPHLASRTCWNAKGGRAKARPPFASVLKLYGRQLHLPLWGLVLLQTQLDHSR
jgi:hypothetical protein